jgi:hypothetical protein
MRYLVRRNFVGNWVVMDSVNGSALIEGPLKHECDTICSRLNNPSEGLPGRSMTSKVLSFWIYSALFGELGVLTILGAINLPEYLTNPLSC